MWPLSVLFTYKFRQSFISHFKRPLPFSESSVSHDRDVGNMFPLHVGLGNFGLWRRHSTLAFALVFLSAADCEQDCGL